MDNNKKSTNTTPDEIRASISSIYSELLAKRKREKEEKEERKIQERELRQQKKEEEEKENGDTKLSKKERREAEINSWKEVVIGLTGDDLEYSSEKKSKKKYHKWIDDDAKSNNIIVDKPKKQKKENYNKKFDSELNMLKSLVADQNKFTIDLQKRFQNAAGPSTKDAMPLTKTLVELASAINASRSNSLGVLREIGNIKKTIADLYMKQKKLDSETSGSGFESTDLGLMGSNIAASLIGDNAPSSVVSQYPASSTSVNQPTAVPSSYSEAYSQVIQQPTTVSAPQTEEFDPNSWGGPDLPQDSSVMYETIPHSVVVEWHKNDNKARFKAIRDDTGEELVGCPVPASDPSKLTFNEKDMIVKGEFDETYKLEIKE